MSSEDRKRLDDILEQQRQEQRRLLAMIDAAGDLSELFGALLEILLSGKRIDRNIEAIAALKVRYERLRAHRVADRGR